MITLDPRLVKLLRGRDLDEDILDEIAPYVGASPERHAGDLANVCHTAFVILDDRPDRQDMLAWQDPRSAEAERLWQSIVERGRSRRPPR